MHTYPAIVRQDGTSFGLSFPDLPGCHASGLTLQEVLESAHDVLQRHLDGLAETGETPAAPYSAELHQEPSDRLALITVETAAQPVTISIALDKRLLARIDRHCARAGFTARADFFAALARNELQRASGARPDFRDGKGGGRPRREEQGERKPFGRKEGFDGRREGGTWFRKDEGGHAAPRREEDMRNPRRKPPRREEESSGRDFAGPRPARSPFRKPGGKPGFDRQDGPKRSGGGGFKRDGNRRPPRRDS